MKYEDLVKEARADIPEFDREYRKQLEGEVIYTDSGVHVVFSYVFVPLVIKAVKANDKSLEKKVFDFVEKMAQSDDKKVSEVCDFTVMEELHDEISDDVLKPLLGRDSLVSLSAVSGYMHEG